MSEVYFLDRLDNGIPIYVEGVYEPNQEVSVYAYVHGAAVPIVLTPAEEDRLIASVIDAARRVI